LGWAGWLLWAIDLTVLTKTSLKISAASF
jgi:hypothetical protein